MQCELLTPLWKSESCFLLLFIHQLLYNCIFACAGIFFANFVIITRFAKPALSKNSVRISLKDLSQNQGYLPLCGKGKSLWQVNLWLGIYTLSHCLIFFLPGWVDWKNSFPYGQITPNTVTRPSISWFHSFPFFERFTSLNFGQCESLPSRCPACRDLDQSSDAPHQEMSQQECRSDVTHCYMGEEWYCWLPGIS